MARETINAVGWMCPKPAIEMTIVAPKLKKGDILEVVADCHTFEDDVRKWCERNRKVLIFIRDEGNGVKRCQIQI